PDTEQVVKGPRFAAAYDESGAPTRALQGFARGHGIDVADVRKVTVGGGEYAGYVRTVVGRQAAEVLADLVPEIVTGLRAGKNMRWDAPGLSFARPIRWLLALLDGHEVPLAVSGLTAGRTTRVHRTAAEPAVDVPDAASLVAVLREHGIEPDPARRRARVVEDAGALARARGGVIDFAGEEALVEEIVNLVEEPVAVLGAFDEKYLELPQEILTTVMRKHQRYLPVRTPDGGLMPCFVAVANGECDHDAVRAGNEAVLRARYEDASFFYHQDLQRTPEQIKEGLGRLTFTERLGSMADRSARIAAIAAELADRLDLTGAERDALRRAAELAKFDLASSMVIELPSLAGTMAREYARRSGEDEAVARALYEMELPRSAGDALPTSPPGAVLAVADRLDLLAGLFAVGSVPTGGSDPFGLRRAALAVTAILRSVPRLAPVTVGDGLAAAARRQPIDVAPEAVAEAERFVARRLEQSLLDEGLPVHVVRDVRPHAGPRRGDRGRPGEAARLPDVRAAHDGAAARPAHRSGRRGRRLRPGAVHRARRAGAARRVRRRRRRPAGRSDAAGVLRDRDHPHRPDRRLLRRRHGDGRGPGRARQPPRLPRRDQGPRRARPRLARDLLGPAADRPCGGPRQGARRKCGGAAAGPRSNAGTTFAGVRPLTGGPLTWWTGSRALAGSQ